MKEFKGKVAVVTGAASGIGRGLAERCAREGMKVVLADIEEAPLKKAEDALLAGGANVLAVPTDVSRPEDIEALAEKTLGAFGEVHLLFNNAGVQTGVQRHKSLWENTPADWEWVIGVNLGGVINGIRVFVPIMLEQQTDCHVVNAASVVGLVPGTEIGIYRVTKAAVFMLSETLYLQLKECDARIGVSVYCPGGVHSRLNYAERNRPGGLQNSPEDQPLTPRQQTTQELFQELNDNAMPRDEFAGIIFQAIGENKLYILSHPEYNDNIKRRAENILQGCNPEMEQVL